MNICLIHFSIFPQEGAFALVFKSIHFPGEAIATRSVRAMVSLNCNALKFPCSLLALSVFWDEPFPHNFSMCQWTGAGRLQSTVSRYDLWCLVTICAFKDKELRFLKSCAFPGNRAFNKGVYEGLFQHAWLVRWPCIYNFESIEAKTKVNYSHLPVADFEQMCCWFWSILSCCEGNILRQAMSQDPSVWIAA